MSHAPSTSKVPPEILDYIVDHLHNDSEALVSCSLVSRQFLPSAHRHLFSTFTYLARRHDNNFIFLIQFIKSHETLHIKHNIQNLVLDGDYTSDVNGMIVVRPTPLFASQFREILDFLSSLQNVTLKGIQPFQDDALSTGLLRSLRTLRLENLHHFQDAPPPHRRTCDTADIYSIVSQISDIHKLELHDLCFIPCDFSWIDIQMRPTILDIKDLMDFGNFARSVTASFWDNLTSVSWRISDIFISELKHIFVPTLLTLRVRLEISFNFAFGTFC